MLEFSHTALQCIGAQANRSVWSHYVKDVKQRKTIEDFSLDNAQKPTEHTTGTGKPQKA